MLNDGLIMPANLGKPVTGTQVGDKVYLDTSATISGDVNVDSTSVSTDGYIGKASGTNGDFTTAYASGTTITLSSLPTGVSAITADDIVTIVQVNTSGTIVETYSRDDVTITAAGTDPTTLTVTGATFAATDTFVVYTNINEADGVVKDDSAQAATPYMQNVGGEYRAAPTTYTDGDATILQTDVNGNLKVAMSSDIEIGAVELKDGTTDARQAIKVDNATASATPTVGLVGGIYKDALDTYDDNDAVPLHTDASGQLIVNPLGLQATVVDDSAMPATPNILPTGGEYRAATDTYTDGDAVIDHYDINGYKKVVDKAYNSLGEGNIGFEGSPLSSQYVNESLVDTTNVTATTHYYPASTGATMDGYKDLSLTGKFIDADGTLTLTLEVTNDEDTASADWNGAYFYDDELNATVNNKTVTNGTELFSLSANNNNFRYYRWVVVASGATNTVILKSRKKAL